MNLECFLYDVQDSILVLIMNRPEVRNAWNRKMHEEYLEVLKKVNEDDSIRAVILTGTPPAFSSGTDLKSFEGGAANFQSSLAQEGAGSTIKLMHDFKKPIIAAINGAAVGMGITITLMCDIRIAAESAKMCFRFTHLGVVPEYASPYMLPRIVGLGRAMELCLTARTFGAQEALNMGLVTQVVPDDQLIPAAMELARNLASKKEHAIRMTREMLYRHLDTDFDEAVRRDAVDFIEAVRLAFGDK
ncbi:enoyl-CoA hydratase/isomerase family protein [Desulfoscipio geothermicus]|uniref:Enoyl-CoA hydratase/carnithine racemase n=1 Tax=Desulfoscipio geothermicus DSM 3669 TaxID=1121426 RepID=A0A1I6DGJ1_9FIRM|nr:enoyl-CoA hydratase/isomerase family protein [Desulfoscipio geothermicus]SFR04590.1 Enoyl-CoA hydratase/carnithine racemase [Desulfoscipio geothermicus DSM 3669]